MYRSEGNTISKAGLGKVGKFSVAPDSQEQYKLNKDKVNGVYGFWLLFNGKFASICLCTTKL